MLKPITVFHKSQGYLVEVKRYKVLYAARRWARRHPDVEVYCRIQFVVDGAEVATPIWLTFAASYGRPNAIWLRLDEGDIEELPEALESYSVKQAV